MDWIQVTITTKTEGIEAVTGRLYQLGITGIEIEDENEFNEFLEQNKQYWDYVDEELVKKMSGETRIKVYICNDANGNELLISIKNSLNELKKMDADGLYGTLDISIANMREEDWADNWRQYFKPLKIGKKILVRPQWEDIPDDAADRIVFTIEPGIIFGTGMHNTTQLCIEAIEKYVKAGDTVLDLGCGSGILSIISLLLGASNALAVDIDPNAEPIAYANAEMNGLSRDRYVVLTGDVINDEVVKEKIGYNKYDVVLANIVADVIISLSGIVPSQLKDNGILIASGIINERLEEVIAALESNGFEILEINKKGEWAGVVCRRGA